MSLSVNTVEGADAALAAGQDAASKQPMRWSRVVAADIVGIYDIFAVIAGSTVPAMIYGRMGGVVTDWMLLTQASLAAAIITHLMLRNLGQYDTARMHDFPRNPATLLLALTVGCVATFGLGFPSAIRHGHAFIWLATWMSASFTLLLAFRCIAHVVLRKMTASGCFDQRIAVFGAGQIARRVHDSLVNPQLGIKFTGVYDDRMGEERINPEGLDVAGRLDDLIQAARDDKIDQIVIALPQSADRRMVSVAKKLEQLPVSVHIVTHIASDIVDSGPAYKVSNIGSVGLLDVKKKALADWGVLIKRIEDIVLGSALAIVALALLPFIALAIKLDSKGPVFIRQQRRGLNKKVIDVVKFRTMYVPEEGSDGLDDQRVTRVGLFLRRTGLDELPQVWNVLKGDMSLVGPRPHALAHDEKSREMVEFYANRHEVKPGITGLAQISELRGEAATPDSLEAHVNADVNYIKAWSLGLDLRILATTAWMVLTGKNPR